MVFQFEHVSLDQSPGNKWDYHPLNLTDLKTSWNRWQRGLADKGWNSLYLGNHDQPRHVSRFGDDGQYRYESATLWATLLHLHRGTPYVYQGEEIGMTNANFTSIDQYRDVESLNFYTDALSRGWGEEAALQALAAMSRDNARTPMQWNGGENAGFTTGTPWIPVNSNFSRINAEKDRAAEKSIYRYYQKLISLRHQSPVVALGDFHLLHPEHEVLYAFRRSLGDQQFLVECNVSGGNLEIPTDLGVGDLILGNYEEPGEPHWLRPWEARIMDISRFEDG